MTDIEKVKDLAISGHWSPGSCIWYTDVLVDILTINKLFVHLERFTLVDAQHTPDHTADLVFADESLYLSNGVQLQDPNYENMTEYRKGLLDYREGLFEHICEDKRVWAGLKPYPWLELGILVERQQGGTTSGVRPRKTESRLATEEDRQRVMPDLELRKWYSGSWVIYD